jgi:hypothetical protein
VKAAQPISENGYTWLPPRPPAKGGTVPNIHVLGAPRGKRVFLRGNGHDGHSSCIRHSLSRAKLCVMAVVEGKDAKHGNRTRLWQIAAFSETVQSALTHLSQGDSVIVQGTHKAEIHERNGEVILLFGVIAEHVLPLRHPSKKQKKEGQAATHRGGDPTGPPRFLQ